MTFDTDKKLSKICVESERHYRELMYHVCIKANVTPLYQMYYCHLFVSIGKKPRSSTFGWSWQYKRRRMKIPKNVNMLLFILNVLPLVSVNLNYWTMNHQFISRVEWFQPKRFLCWISKEKEVTSAAAIYVLLFLLLFCLYFDFQKQLQGFKETWVNQGNSTRRMIRLKFLPVCMASKRNKNILFRTFVQVIMPPIAHST